MCDEIFSTTFSVFGADVLRFEKESNGARKPFDFEGLLLQSAETIQLSRKISEL